MKQEKKGLVYGVGINDADYPVHEHEPLIDADGKKKWTVTWRCPFYRVWTGMLERGYSGKYKLKNPTYKDVIVCKEWHLFSTFRAWMVEQPWEEMELDKDVLLHGNKVYCPEACVFVCHRVNTFLIGCGAARGEFKVGVNWHKRDCKFQAR